MTPDMLQALNRAATQGWDGIDDPEGLIAAGQAEAEKQDSQRRKIEVQIIRDCFETSAGKRVLDLLRAQTIDRPPSQADLDERDPHAFALRQARLMGARHLVFGILEALDEAHGIEAKETGRETA